MMEQIRWKMPNEDCALLLHFSKSNRFFENWINFLILKAGSWILDVPWPRYCAGRRNFRRNEQKFGWDGCVGKAIAERNRRQVVVGNSQFVFAFCKWNEKRLFFFNVIEMSILFLFSVIKMEQPQILMLMSLLLLLLKWKK